VAASIAFPEEKPLSIPAQAATAATSTPSSAPHPAGTPFRQREEPVRWHGATLDYREPVAQGRNVIEVPGVTWPIARPEDCRDESGRGIWFAADGRQVDPRGPDGQDGILLLCPQCGLDGT
jgi:hypothetical protein